MKSRLDGWPLNLGFLLLLVCLFCIRPVPESDEGLYLILPYKLFHSSFLANDWTISGRYNTHLVFNAVVGSMTVLPLDVVAWLGRVACWLTALIALYSLGGVFGLPRHVTTVALALWLTVGQAIVGEDWIVGFLTARSVGHILVLYALLAFAKGRDRRGAVLLGLAIAFHPLTGLWCTGAAGLALLLTRRPLLPTVRSALWGLPFAALGLVPLLFGGAGMTPGEAEFWVRTYMVDSIDPFYGSGSRRITILLLAGFNWLAGAAAENEPALRFLSRFERALLGCYLASIAFRYLHLYPLLIPFSVNVFPVFVTLFFYFWVLRAYWVGQFSPHHPRLALFALLGLLCVGSPVVGLAGRLRGTWRHWMARNDQLSHVFAWVSRNTPPEAIVIAPPWRGDTWYRSERATIALWHHAPPGRVTEWRERIAALVGPGFEPQPEDEWEWEMEGRYNRLTPALIEEIRRRYGGDYLIASMIYAYPLLFQEGDYRVYQLPPRAPGSAYRE